ncbi:MAG: alpha-amylase family glycosyl hydrolase, partial [Bacteroidota bacterium]
NDWGPNNSGQIATTAPSLMTFDAALNEHRYTISLDAGGGPVSGGYAYKIHYHQNTSGSNFVWITDPLGTETTGPNNDSVVRVSDPMAFQLAREQDASGQIAAVSVGLFGSEAFTTIAFTVNETTYTSGIVDTGDGIYRLELPAPVPPGSLFRVEATDASGDMVSAEVGTLPPDVVDAPVPAFLEDGITHSDAGDGTTWLVLRAPAKSYVYALGDFNGWTADESSLMFRDATDPIGTRWWIRLDGLTPGEEVAFQYFVDGTLRVADPYSPVVIYPGEAGFPTGQTDFAVGQFTVGGHAFDWTDQDFEAPAQEDLVVYELLVRDFLRDHSFVSLTDTLDYLQRLGVNAIELMPVAEFDGDESWGYNPAFHLALDKYYGTPAEFKAFVNEAHARGIA